MLWEPPRMRLSEHLFFLVPIYAVINPVKSAQFNLKTYQPLARVSSRLV